jgi:glycoside/pentoside/hexuronide:cation symporter, GPH family
VEKTLTVNNTIAYAAPAIGIGFFYVPMWSVLPAVYAKYFGLSLTAIAGCVLVIRLFDGFVDTAIGYLSDWHQSRGGHRPLWVIVGCAGSIVACWFLFVPPSHAGTGYYLGWSLVYFLAFTIAAIPHLAWGSELTLDYQRRAQVFAIYCVMRNVGIGFFYALPLIMTSASNDFTPRILADAVYVGAALSILGLACALLFAPQGIVTATAREDSLRLLRQSVTRNKPLLLYLAAFGCDGLCYGMWFGLLYLYLDSYLNIGSKLAVILLVATVLQTAAIPIWLKLISKSSKAAAWATCGVLFAAQLIGCWFLSPGGSWWLVFLVVVFAHLCMGCHDVAALSMLGDIVDYGKLKFRKDRGATYVALYTLVFKIGLGIGGGLAIGIAGQFGYIPSEAVHTNVEIFGLKLGFIILPACFVGLGLLFILRAPINRRRHGIIQRRIQSRTVIENQRAAQLSLTAEQMRRRV